MNEDVFPIGKSGGFRQVSLPRPKVSVLPLAMLEHFRWGDQKTLVSGDLKKRRRKLAGEIVSQNKKNSKSRGFFLAHPKKKGELEDVAFFCS